MVIPLLIQSMIISAWFDHRLIDGSGGAKFINAIRDHIENMNLENLTDLFVRSKRRALNEIPTKL